MNLRITQARKHLRDPPWLWNSEQTSPEVQNRGISGPTKRTYALQIFLKNKKNNKTILILIFLRFLYSVNKDCCRIREADSMENVCVPWYLNSEWGFVNSLRAAKSYLFRRSRTWRKRTAKTVMLFEIDFRIDVVYLFLYYQFRSWCCKCYICIDLSLCKLDLADIIFIYCGLPIFRCHLLCKNIKLRACSHQEKAKKIKKISSPSLSPPSQHRGTSPFSFLPLSPTPPYQ